MAGEDVTIIWDHRALDVLFAEVEGPLLEDLTQDVEEIARAIAPVRVRHKAIPRYAKKGYVGVPGHLEASVRSYIGEDYLGPYGDVAAFWYGRFLDPPAKQLHRLHPFLPTALYTAVEGRTYFL
jgi:hypothetical protein